MKIFKKIAILIICATLIAIFGFLIWAFAISFNAKIDKNALINVNRQVIFLDKDGAQFSNQSDGREICTINDIPKHVIDAFVFTEDKRFYKHKGIDYKGLLRAFLNNAKSLSFKEGGSTITQQLIKNTHLTNEKTLKRKIIELKLATNLEKNYSKNQILEME